MSKNLHPQRDGWLYKRSSWLQEFERQFFILKGSKLLYSTDSSSKVRNEINLSLYKNVSVAHYNKYSIKISGNGQPSFALVAQSLEDRNLWINEISAVVGNNPDYQANFPEFAIETDYSKHEKITTVLSKFLTLTDFGRLDTAFCVKKNNLRYHFINFLLMNNCLNSAISCYEWLPCNNGLFAWLAPRFDCDTLDGVMFLVDFKSNDLLEFVQANAEKSEVLNVISCINGIKLNSLHQQTAAFPILFDLLVATGDNLRELHMTNTKSSVNVNDFLNAAAAHCSNLLVLNTSECVTISEQCVMNVCMDCKLLAELNVQGCYHMSAHLINCIVVHCRNLTSLDIRNCSRMRKNEIMYFAYYHAKPLKELKMNVLLTDFSLKMLINNTGEKLHTLQIRVSLNQHEHKHHELKFITDDSILSMKFDCCPNLTKLDITNHSHLTITSIKAILKSLPLLQYLCMKGIQFDTPGWEKMMIKSLFKMQNLKILLMDQWEIVFKKAVILNCNQVVQIIVASEEKTDLLKACSNLLQEAFRRQNVAISTYLLNLIAKISSSSAAIQQLTELPADNYRATVLKQEIFINLGTHNTWYDKDGNTPLIATIIKNYPISFHSLLKSGVDCNGPNKNTGDTPLMVAVRIQNTAMVRSLLLCQDINTAAKNKKGDSVINLAFKGRYYSEIDILLAQKGVVWKHNESLLQWDVSCVALFNLVVQLSPSIATFMFHKYASGLNLTALSNMFKLGRYKNIEHTDTNGYTALMCATKSFLLFEEYELVGSGDVVKPDIAVLEYLIQIGCSVETKDKKGQNVLHYCAYSKADCTGLLDLFLMVCPHSVKERDLTGRHILQVAQALKKHNQVHFIQEFCTERSIDID